MTQHANHATTSASRPTATSPPASSPPGTADAADARRLWVLLEPIHCTTYFRPEPRAAFEAAGLRGYWRGYFAGRAAPFGPVGPAVVTATFYNFAPAMVERAVPDVWSRATPEAALDARLAGATEALRGFVAGVLPEAAVTRCADLAWRAVEQTETAGRPLAAANAALDRPADPLAALWQAATFWREFRGDGHVAALTAAGVGGLECHVLRVARDGGRELIQPFRGWTDDEWEAAVLRLRDRGLVDAAGRATEAGTRLAAEIEARTDAVAAALAGSLSPAERDTLADLLAPLAVALAERGIPYPNPAGAPSPSPSPRPSPTAAATATPERETVR